MASALVAVNSTLYAVLPLTTPPSSRPVTVTVCGVAQFSVVKSSPETEVLAMLAGLAPTDTCTAAVGCE